VKSRGKKLLDTEIGRGLFDTIRTHMVCIYFQCFNVVYEATLDSLRPPEPTLISNFILKHLFSEECILYQPILYKILYWSIFEKLEERWSDGKFDYDFSFLSMLEWYLYPCIFQFLTLCKILILYNIRLTKCRRCSALQIPNMLIQELLGGRKRVWIKDWMKLNELCNHLT